MGLAGSGVLAIVQNVAFAASALLLAVGMTRADSVVARRPVAFLAGTVGLGVLAVILGSRRRGATVEVFRSS
ncbi:hypothetical protein [Microbacterium sp. SLBN-154]|uniref:hypothetical protein n=1 Tax=Microbacterium sp. SLBN-154 TaxID=2768458 RepID=UPI001152B0DE|nr:hypothetical protein [Microbacterium sp. SLBN-154]